MANSVIKLRRGLIYYVENYTPTVGELIWVSQDNRNALYVGDGYTRGGRSCIKGFPRIDISDKRFYGVSKEGLRGFYTEPRGVSINPNIVSISGSTTLDESFGYLKSIKMPTASDSSISFIIEFLDLWNIDKDINIKLTYSMTSGNENELVKLDCSYWVTKNTLSISSGSPDNTFTDYIRCDTQENSDKLGITNLYNIKISNSDLDSSVKSIIVKLDRDGTDASDTFSGTFEISNIFCFQVSNATDYGYYMGGCDSSSNGGVTSTIDRITFPFNNGTSQVFGNLTVARQGMSSCNSSMSAYCSGGTDTLKTTNYSTIDKILFPFNSGNSTNISNIDINKKYTSGCNCSSHGFVFGGSDATSKLSTIVKILFEYEGSAFATNNGSLSSSKESTISLNSNVCGYIMGGYNTASISTIDKFLFSFNNGVNSNVAQYISSGSTRLLGMTNDDAETVGTYSAAGFNSSLYGYIAGGDKVSSIDRIQFVTDSATSVTRGNLSENSKLGVCGCNSSQAGYIMGGMSAEGSTYTTSIERLNFAFDDSNSVSVGNLSSSRHNRGSSIDGIDFVTMFV